MPETGNIPHCLAVAYPGFFRGVQKIQLRIEGRENRDLGAVAPYSGVTLNLQMDETHILIRLLRMYIPRNWEFGSTLEKLRNFGGGVSKPPSVRHCCLDTWPSYCM
jgi:hypothetical protein